MVTRKLADSGLRRSRFRDQSGQHSEIDGGTDSDFKVNTTHRLCRMRGNLGTELVECYWLQMVEGRSFMKFARSERFLEQIPGMS